jgi:uncharacterized BrkB/YihY/UPF0761 family membrane protein
MSSLPPPQRFRRLALIPDLFVEVVNLGGLSVKELARQVAHEVWQDKCFSRAAQLAYFFFFALFPFFLFLTTNLTYGSIGTVIVLLTWLYLIGVFILIGGEINSEIEHAAREGKEPGEKTL